MASAIVTVARMIGMAIGVAILTAYGSTTINHLYDELFAVPDGWKAVIPDDLRDRPLRDAFVVDALESWAAGQASQILVGLFVVAGVVTVVAIPPGLALGGAARTRMLADDRARPRRPAAGDRAGAGWTRRATPHDRPLSAHRDAPGRGKPRSRRRPGSSAGRRRASRRSTDIDALAGMVAEPDTSSGST